MQDNGKYRVAIYCRVANAADGDEWSIRSQVRTLRTFAKKLGFLNCTEYLDNGYSGTTADRPAFAKMCEDIRSGVVGAVVVKDIARISRNYLLFHAWLDDMWERGVNVYTPEGKLEDDLHPFRKRFQALYTQRGKRVEQATVINAV